MLIPVKVWPLLLPPLDDVPVLELELAEDDEVALLPLPLEDELLSPPLLAFFEPLLVSFRLTLMLAETVPLLEDVSVELPEEESFEELSEVVVVVVVSSPSSSSSQSSSSSSPSSSSSETSNQSQHNRTRPLHAYRNLPHRPRHPQHRTPPHCHHYQSSMCWLWYRSTSQRSCCCWMKCLRCCLIWQARRRRLCPALHCERALYRRVC